MASIDINWLGSARDVTFDLLKDPLVFHEQGGHYSWKLLKNFRNSWKTPGSQFLTTSVRPCYDKLS